MKINVALFIRLSCLLLALPLAAAPPADGEAKRLHELFDAEWEWTLREHPTLATNLGDLRYNDRWTDLSLEAIDRRAHHHRETLEKIKSFDRAKLSPSDQLNYDLFLRNAAIAVEEDQFPGELIQVTGRRGPHQELAELVSHTRLQRPKDYADLLKRLRAFPARIEQILALLQKGLEKNIVPPRVILRNVAQDIDNHLPRDPTQSPIYQTAFRVFPAPIPSEEQKRLREQGEAAIRESVFPSLRKLRNFLVREYEPRARNSIGLSALPNGEAWYALRIKAMTTTDLSPEEIHRIGLLEVKRLRGEMEKVMGQVGFKGDLRKFFIFLKTDPKFFFTDKSVLLLTYRDIAKRIDPELVKLFGKLPRQPYGVSPVPAYSEKTETTAYYQPGSAEAVRAGVFFANTYDLKSRPKWEMEALVLHEAVPGHHLQLALSQELPDVPKFRRHGGYTGFVEGWGLYAESLGPELGLYADHYSKFGQLTFEMWRAIRLVVDTGMHAMGWSREQALQYFRDNSARVEHDITVEIDRYISWPAQALAYKLGELKFKELRAYASKELGEQFDVREFHDQLLAEGALPLAAVDARIRRWAANQKNVHATTSPKEKD